MRLEDVVERAAYARSGYTLAAFKEAALPVYVLTARVLTLEKKPISPIEEACLRAVEAGLVSAEDLSGFLGLPPSVLKGTLAGLNSREQINYIRPSAGAAAQVLLTQKGRMALATAKIIEPEERLVKLVFDPLLKKVVFLPTAALFRPKEVKEQGWMEIPTCGAKRPEVEDVPLADIDKAVRRMPSGQDQSRELLAVRRLERRELQFTPCIALYYRANAGRDVQLAFYRDDGPSVIHETAFAELGGPELIGATHILEPRVGPEVDGLNVVRPTQAMSEEVAVLGETIAVATATESKVDDGKVSTPAEKELLQKAEEAKARLRAMTQRELRCHEHPKLLTAALTQSKNRLLIIAPWINHHVVDERFVRSLEALLRNGVDVYIGYGLGTNEDIKGNDKARGQPPITPEVEREFDDLRKRFDNLTVKCVGNTHRKQLVSDDKFAVITSFNWLTFKGDPRKKARDEFGILVSEPGLLESIFQDGLKLITEGYDHPPPGHIRPSGQTGARRAQ